MLPTTSAYSLDVCTVEYAGQDCMLAPSTGCGTNSGLENFNHMATPSKE